jgi:hypothetical protein
MEALRNMVNLLLKKNVVSIVIIICIVSVGLLSPTGIPGTSRIVHAADLISNGSFELVTNGTPDNWSFSSMNTNGTMSVISGGAYNGTKSVELNAAGSTDRAVLSQWHIPVTANQLYRFTSRYKIMNGPIGGSAFMKVTWYDSSKKAITPTYPTNTIQNNSNWMLLTRDLTSPAEAAYATVQLEVRYGGTVRFDYVTMEAVNNLIGNGSFEQLDSNGNLNNWAFSSVNTGGSHSPQSSGGYDQNKHVRVDTYDADDRVVLSQWYIPVSAGKRYQMTAVYKVSSLGGKLYMKATFYDANQTAITPTTNTFGQNKTDWTEMIRIIMAPPNAAYVTFQLHVDQGASTVYWDHVRIEELSDLTDAWGNLLPVTHTDDLPMEILPAEFWSMIPSAVLSPPSDTLWTDSFLRYYYFGLENDGYSSLDKPKRVDDRDASLIHLNPTVGVEVPPDGPTMVIADDIPYHPLVSSKSPYSNKYYARGNGGQLYTNYIPAYALTHDVKYLDRAKELANFMRYSQYTADGDNDFTRIHYPSDWSEITARGDHLDWIGGWDYQFDWTWTDAYGYTFDLHSPDHHVGSMLASGMVYLYNYSGNINDLNSAYDFVYNQFSRYGYHSGLYQGRRYYWTGYNPDANGTPDDGSRPIWDATDNVMGMTARAAAQVGYHKNDARMLEYARGLLWYLVREFNTDGRLYYDGAENPKNARRSESHEVVTLWQAMQALPYLMKAGVDVTEEKNGIEQMVKWYIANHEYYGSMQYVRANKVYEGNLAPNEQLAVATYVQATNTALNEVKWFDSTGTGYSVSDPLDVRISRLNPPSGSNSNWTIDANQDKVYRISPSQLSSGIVMPWTMQQGDVYRISYQVTTDANYDPAVHAMPQGSFGVFVTAPDGNREYRGVGVYTQPTSIATRVTASNFLSFPAQILFPFSSETNVTVVVNAFGGTSESYPGDGTWGGTSAKRYIYHFSTMLPPSDSNGRPYSVLSNGPVNYSAIQNGDYVQFDIYQPQSCTNCNIKSWYAKSNKFGIWQASIDGVSQGTAQDGYATSLRTVSDVSLGSASVSKGTRQVQFTVSGKNSSSNGYEIAPGSITVERP